jgi:NADH-quinone oxidoreductase subunit H
MQVWFMWAVALACFAVALIYLLPWAFSSSSFAVAAIAGLNGAFWFLLKVTAYIYVFMWLRFTLPRYRFDQLMHLGWYILIPLAIVNVFSVGVAMLLEVEFGWNRWIAMILTTVFTLLIAVLLVRLHDKRTVEASTATTTAVTTDSYAG